MSIVVYGPQGCGKTRNKAALAAHFGLSNIIDDWSPGDTLPEDTLALTNTPGVEGAIAFSQENAPKMARIPFTDQFIPCTCGAQDKDDCACIRAAIRS